MKKILKILSAVCIFIICNDVYSQSVGNLVTNGDFEQGNNGTFDTDYDYNSSSIWSEGTYAIASNPNNVHSNFVTMDDHTASGSLMMAVNGATTPDEIVWSQTINNIPANTDCIFSVWVATICAGNEANIYFRINDNVIGNLNASTVVGEWNQFFAVWNSGNTTSATIKLTNQNTMGGGNDFALDDIYFAPITCPPLNNNGPLCEGETLMLEAESHIGATYHWSGPQNFSSTQQNPTRPNVTTAMAGTYTCYITVPSPYNPSIVGTSSTESTAVTINSTPSADFTFTTVCEGSPTQFHSDDDNPQQTIYNWNFGDGNTSTSQNPTHTYANAGTYTVKLTTNISSCGNEETKQVTVNTSPTANAGQDQTIEYGGTATLSGSGGNGTFTYSWEPADKVVNPNAQTTTTRELTQPTTFTLTVTSTTSSDCTDQDQVTINIDGSAMTTSINADDTEICQGESTTLHAMASGGTSNYTYTWIPTTGLSNPNIPNPVASPDVTTEYTCTISDGQTQQTPEITITVHPTPNANATADETTIGFIETTTLRGSGGSTGASYHWEPADKVVNADEQTTETEPLETTTAFTLFITNPSGCIDSTEIIIMVEGSSMTATVSADDTEICQGESTTLKAEPLGGSGLYSYEWTDDNGESLSTDQTTTVSPDKTTTYTCTIDDRMTQIEKSITITVNEWIETSIDTIACGSFTIEEQGQVYTNSDPVPDTINSNLYTENEYGCFMTNLKLVLYSSSQISPITGITPPLFFTGTGFDIFEYSIKEVTGGGAEQGIISYKWELVPDNNWELLGETTSNVLVSLTSPGSAYLYCYVTTACDIDTLRIPIYTPGYEIGVEEHNVSSMLNIHPNPTDGNVFISYPELADKASATISVYNSIGILVKEFDTQFTPSMSSISFSMDEFDNGLYIIKVTGKEFNIYKKLILNK